MCFDVTSSKNRSAVRFYVFASVSSLWNMSGSGSVKKVVLGDRGEVILDITALTQYSGQGKCVEVNSYNYPTANTYWEEAKTWARRIDWMFRDLNGQPFFFTLFKYIPV